MSYESINYGNWVPKKLLYFWLLISSFFFVLSLFPLLFFLNLIFWFLTGISLFLFLYFLYAYIIFNKNNGEFQTKLRNIVDFKISYAKNLNPNMKSCSSGSADFFLFIF